MGFWRYAARRERRRFFFFLMESVYAGRRDDGGSVRQPAPKSNASRYAEPSFLRGQISPQSRDRSFRGARVFHPHSSALDRTSPTNERERGVLSQASPRSAACATELQSVQILSRSTLSRGWKARVHTSKLSIDRSRDPNQFPGDTQKCLSRNHWRQQERNCAAVQSERRDVERRALRRIHRVDRAHGAATLTLPLHICSPLRNSFLFRSPEATNLYLRNFFKFSVAVLLPAGLPRAPSKSRDLYTPGRAGKYPPSIFRGTSTPGRHCWHHLWREQLRRVFTGKVYYPGRNFLVY